jgi:hypothetical protein
VAIAKDNMSESRGRVGNAVQPPAQQAHHVVELELGGSGNERRRSEQLRVLPRGWKAAAMRETPITRDDCPTMRPCPHVKCEWNLWMDDAVDRVPGRGHTGPLGVSDVTVRDEMNCGLDIVEASQRKPGRRGLTPVWAIAGALACTERSVYLYLARAMRKLRADPEAMKHFIEMVGRVRDQQQGASK